MAVKLSSLFGTFKAQAMGTQGLTATMDTWAGTTLNRAIMRGKMTNRAVRASMNTRGLGGTWGLMRPGIQSSALRGAMIGVAVGAGTSVLGDTMGNNLNGGSVGRAIGGGFRGGLMGGLTGGALGALRPSMGSLGAMNRGSARLNSRSRMMRRNASFESRFR